MRVVAPPPGAPSLPVTGVRLSLWRAVCILRVAALAVCLFLIVMWQPIYRRPHIALLAGAGMVVVTAVLLALALRGHAHRRSIVFADLVVTLALTLLTVPAQTTAQQHGGMVTLTTIWAAGPTVEAAIVAAPLGGVLTALVQYAFAASIADLWQGRTLYSGVLLILTGAVAGAVTKFACSAEGDLRAAEAARAALAERERLARTIHDGVLQVLALVHRAGAHGDDEWRRLADAAGEQESALRRLIVSQPVVPPAAGVRDLAAGLRELGSSAVTVAAPADPVLLDAHPATEMLDAVRAALHNVVMHAGADAHAWVLVDDLDGEVHVCVRDDGAGFAADRLEDAARDGRVGVARSIRGRLRELGGSARITSSPGAGTEVHLVVPR